MYRDHHIAVVVPAYREARLLPGTLRGVPHFVDHIIVIDDGSDDETASVGHAARPEAETIRHGENQGVGAAITTGYLRSLELGADIAVVIGADGQMDPAEMTALLDPIVEGRADYTKGDRLGHPLLWRRMPWRRIFGSWVLTWMTRAASGHWQVRDSQCGYTAIRNQTLAALPLRSLYPRYGYPNDMLIRLGELGARVLDRPITPIYGTEASGLKIHRVMGPIAWLICKGGTRRMVGRLKRRPLEAPHPLPVIREDA
ncbi:MAG: glycosyltransferase family 2 protein [Bradymonadia bacterium]